MILLDWALCRLRGSSSDAETPEAGPRSSSPDSRWRASHDQPSGLAQSHGDIRLRMLELARDRGVERVALLRANGSLFCGQANAGREEFAAAVQQIAIAARRASRRMGLGAIESVVLEGDAGAIVVATGHSICGVQCASPALPPQALEGARILAGGEDKE